MKVTEEMIEIAWKAFKESQSSLPSDEILIGGSRPMEAALQAVFDHIKKQVDKPNIPEKPDSSEAGENLSQLEIEKLQDKITDLESDLAVLADQIFDAEDLNKLKEATKLNFPDEWKEYEFCTGNSPKDVAEPLGEEIKVQLKGTLCKECNNITVGVIPAGSMLKECKCGNFYIIMPIAHPEKKECICKNIKPGDVVAVKEVRNPVCMKCGEVIILKKPKKQTLLEYAKDNYFFKPKADDGMLIVLKVISECLEENEKEHLEQNENNSK